MPVDSLDDLPILQTIVSKRNALTDLLDVLDQPKIAAEVLEITESLDTVSLRLVELESSDSRLRAISEVAEGRAKAASTCQDVRVLALSASLVGAIGLMTGDTSAFLRSRVLLAESELLRGRTVDAEQIAVGAVAAEQRLGEDAGAVDMLSLIRSAGDVGTSYRPTIDVPEEARDEVQDGTSPWERTLTALARDSYSESADPLWRDALADCTRELDQVLDPVGLVEMEVRLKELLGVITSDQGLGSPYLRPVVISRAVAIHRLRQLVFEEQSDSIAGIQDRTGFYKSFVRALNGDPSPDVPIDDRILIARYGVYLDQNATGVTDLGRYEKAKGLVELYRENNDRDREIETRLEVGACLEKIQRMSEMYDVYARALELAKQYDLTSGMIWSTIRLSYAHFLAKDPRTATQLLLDLERSMPPDRIRDVDEQEAMAEAKVALANLFTVARAHSGARDYWRQAAEMFETMGKEDRAWECRAKVDY
ncbi:MAG: hypothetical protein ACTIL2_03055 [Corynebacterium sp.]|uniref:hypothetical protein n=1 Tax=Corynebacterium sp. TaxID=1720 RepID=UPI003F9C4513